MKSKRLFLLLISLSLVACSSSISSYSQELSTQSYESYSYVPDPIDTSELLSQYHGTYYLFSEFLDNNEECSLVLKEDHTYQIAYQSVSYVGEYTIKEVDNETAFKGRKPIYTGEPDYPDNDHVLSYEMHFKSISVYDSLPSVLYKFFKRYVENQNLLQFIYIHTFVDIESYNHYGRSKELVGNTDNAHIYKEISYYPNESPSYDADMNPIPYYEARKLDPAFDFVQVSKR